MKSTYDSGRVAEVLRLGLVEGVAVRAIAERLTERSEHFVLEKGFRTAPWTALDGEDFHSAALNTRALAHARLRPRLEKAKNRPFVTGWVPGHR